MATNTDLPNSTKLLSQFSGLRRIVFYATVITLLGLMGSFLADTLVFLFTSWFLGDPGVHHLHDLALVAMLWTVIVGLLVQVYNPERRVAAVQQALLVNVVITGSNLLIGFFFPPALILGGLLITAVVLHPAGWGVLRIRTVGPVSYPLVGLVVLAGIPLALYAGEQSALQATGDVHAQLGHYADMITYSVVILLLGLLASMKPIGWRIPLWSAATLAGVLGVSSMLHPALASSAGPFWGGLALVWGIAFIITGEVTQRSNDVDNAPR